VQRRAVVLVAHGRRRAAGEQLRDQLDVATKSSAVERRGRECHGGDRATAAGSAGRCAAANGLRLGCRCGIKSHVVLGVRRARVVVRPRETRQHGQNKAGEDVDKRGDRSTVVECLQ